MDLRWMVSVRQRHLGSQGNGFPSYTAGMLLMRVVETSLRIGETSKRLEKISLLSGLLRELSGDEIEVVTAILSIRSRPARVAKPIALITKASLRLSHPASSSIRRRSSFSITTILLKFRGDRRR